MNRLERISAILVRLQSRSVVTARQLADQYQVSLRTIYRDIRVLEESGVPITGDAGIGYSLVDGYQLPPLLFSTEEAISFLMAEKLVSRQTDGDSYNLYRSGMDKIRAVLKTVEKDILEDFDRYIHVVETCTQPPSPATDILQPLLGCIRNKKPAVIEYYANTTMEITIREVEPLGLYFIGYSWLLLAWCKLRNDYRSFAIGRIRKITSGAECFSRTHIPFSELVYDLYRDEEKFTVCIRADKSALRHMGVGKYTFGLIKEENKGDYIEQEYETHSLDYFARWYLSFGDQAVIVSPPELKKIVSELLVRVKG